MCDDFVKLQPNLELNWTLSGLSWSWLCFQMSQQQEWQPSPNFDLQKEPTGVSFGEGNSMGV